jgi:hypothetical protein
MNSMKADLIRKYVTNINFKTEDWSIHTMTEEMRKFLGEMPSVDIHYKKDVMVNEVTGKAKEIKQIEKVSIVFTDTDDKIKKLEFKI